MNSIEISSELSDDQIKEYQELFRLVDFNEYVHNTLSKQNMLLWSKNEY